MSVENSITSITKDIQSSNRKKALIYKNGISVLVNSVIGESDIYKRTSWIQQSLTNQVKSVEYNDESYLINKIIKNIKMSEFWLNYVKYGSKYSNIPNKLYLQWEKEKRQKELILKSNDMENDISSAFAGYYLKRPNTNISQDNEYKGHANDKNQNNKRFKNHHQRQMHKNK